MSWDVPMAAKARMATDVAPRRGQAVWETVSIAASRRFMPALTRTRMPSVTTMALSTSIPRARIRAPREMFWRVMSMAPMKMKVPKMVRSRAAPMSAPLDSPVLLLGETGVGKEVLANAIHAASQRRDGPFIKVNCGGLPKSLLDSELFGHENGAFTGAVSRKRGRFERANKGTIFLDEIGELPMAAQVKLLRVLQTKEIERVGGSETVPVDVRIVSATHRNLEDMIREDRFREDLWFRLNVFPIMIPPLRQRPQDVPELVDHFISRKSREMKISRPLRLAPGACNGSPPIAGRAM